MGYDMSLVDPMTADEQLRYDSAREVFEAAVTERDKLPRGSAAALEAQDKVHAAYEAMSAVNVGYFRLNISGMGAMREHMAQIGMLAYEYPDHPAWPELADYGIDEAAYYAMSEEDEKANPDVVRYRAAQEVVLAWSPPDEPGLPVHKFGSNDGWLVTAMDCRSALALCEAYAAANPEAYATIVADWLFEDATTSYFDDWLTFLRRGAEGSGFRVY